MVEQFKVIPEYPKYEASIEGNIRNRRTKRILKHYSSGSTGYRKVSLRINGMLYRRFVHRLVALTFIPNPLDKKVVHHLDSDRTNNSIYNLDWATHSENKLYSVLGEK